MKESQTIVKKNNPVKKVLAKTTPMMEQFLKLKNARSRHWKCSIN